MSMDSHSENTIVLNDPDGNHIDVFGWGEERECEEVKIDGKKIRVLSIGEQIADKLKIFIEDTNQLSPEERTKHQFYAQKLQEIIKVTPFTTSIDDTWQRFRERKTNKSNLYEQEWNQLLSRIVAKGTLS